MLWPYCALVCAFISLCQAMDIPHITELFSIDTLSDDIQVTDPYQLLSGTTYTSDTTVYSYKNYTLKIINKENPDKLLLHITKNVRVNASEAHANINHKLPYWSNSAPNILKTLDFSKVDGQKTEYKRFSVTLIKQSAFCNIATQNRASTQ